MLSRAELKSRAKESVKKYYWAAVLVCFLTTLLSGGIGSSVASRMNGSDPEIKQALAQMDTSLLLGIAAVLMTVILVAAVVSTLWNIFVGNVITVGACRFFMESRERQTSAGVGRLFYIFKSGGYLNTVLTVFLRNLFISLWSLLLVVPGIIKSYQYAMVPYILSENPQMNWREALDLSKKMMDGQKWNLFVLQLSFIGWLLLGILLCGVGIYFVLPYMNAAEAEFYAELRKNSGMIGKGLPGFGDQPEVPYAEETL